MGIRSVRPMASILLIAGMWQVEVGSQSTPANTIERRLTVLETAIRELTKQVTELGGLLKATLPPSPVEDVGPFDLSVATAPSKGSRDARVALIEFSDFQCPFCRQYFQSVYSHIQRQFIDTGRVAYFFKNFPLDELHPFAARAAEAGECAGAQNRFWPMHDSLFANQQALGADNISGYARTLALDMPHFSECVDDRGMKSKVDADVAEAKRLGLTGTPSFMIGEILNSGSVRIKRRIVGAQPLPVFQAALESALTALEPARQK